MLNNETCAPPPPRPATAQGRTYSVPERDGKALPDQGRGAVATLSGEDQVLALQVEMLLAQRWGLPPTWLQHCD